MSSNKNHCNSLWVESGQVRVRGDSALPPYFCRVRADQQGLFGRLEPVVLSRALGHDDGPLNDIIGLVRLGQIVFLVQDPAIRVRPRFTIEKVLLLPGGKPPVP